MDKKIMPLIVSFLLLSLVSFVMAEDPGGFKFLYQVKKDEAKILRAAIQPDLGKFLFWEKGRIIAKDVNSAAGWHKYMDFEPEDLGIRMEEEKMVRIIEPGLITGMYHLPEIKKMAFLMHLGDSINTVLGVEDTAKNRVIYTNPAKIHPMVPGRRMEFMAIENLNSSPCLSEDGRFVAYGGYTYLYSSNVEVVDLTDKKKTVIKGGYSPFIWKDRLYYFMRDEKKKVSVYSAPLSGLKGEKFMDVDFDVSLPVMHRGVLYILSGTNIYSCRLEGEKKFTLTGNTQQLGNGYDKSEIQRFFAATSGKKEYVYVLMRVVKNTKIESRMYSKAVE